MHPHEYLQPTPFRAGPRVRPLCLDRLHWGPAEQRIAAAVLGDQAAHLMVCYRSLAVRWSDAQASVYSSGILWELARRADELAREAWHYASRAVEAEDVEAQTLAGVVR